MNAISPEVQAVNTLVDGFRERNIDKFASLIDPEFVWLDDAGNTIGGKQTLLDGVSGMWRDHPGLVNDVSDCIQIGNLVSHTEKFSNFNDLPDEGWLWVYEFSGNLMVKMIGYKVK